MTINTNFHDYQLYIFVKTCCKCSKLHCYDPKPTLDILKPFKGHIAG